MPYLTSDGKPKKQRRKRQRPQPRAILSSPVTAVFGPPQAGTSTLIKALAESLLSPIHVIQPSWGDLEETVHAAPPHHTIFVDGFPMSAEGVRYLHDHNLVYRGHGMIVLVRIDPEVLAKRSGEQAGLAASKWYEGVPDLAAGPERTHGLPDIENAIRMFSLPYCTIHNTSGPDGFARAACALGNYAGLKE